MCAPADLTRFSIRAQRSLNRVGTTKLERYGSDKQTNNTTVDCLGAYGWLNWGAPTKSIAIGDVRREPIDTHAVMTGILSGGETREDGALRAAQAAFRDGGWGRKSLVRDSHEHGRGLDE